MNRSTARRSVEAMLRHLSPQAADELLSELRAVPGSAAFGDSAEALQRELRSYISSQVRQDPQLGECAQ